LHELVFDHPLLKSVSTNAINLTDDKNYGSLIFIVRQETVLLVRVVIRQHLT